MFSKALLPFLFLPLLVRGADRPNVVLIICDDLNDYVETLGGHPQAKTPNMKRLMDRGVSFTQAHCNIPICNPSRASMVFGLYPHTSQLFGFEKWQTNTVFKNSRTFMDHFRANGYHTLGTGKIMHSGERKEWVEYGNDADYSPLAHRDGKNVAHPDVPSPFRDDFESIDGSFGPLKKVKAPFSWKSGTWRKLEDFKYHSEEDRDLTADEKNGQWAVENLKSLAQSKKPFLMGVGFIRPHTPLIVPQKYFDRFPLESIKLPVIKRGDVEDTFKRTVGSKEDDRSGDRGSKIYDQLIASYGGDRELALKKFIQAYLASVASVDDLIGEILDTIEESALKENTIVILTSDHGWGMGEKDYLYKNSLWQESTRVPLVISAPGLTKPGTCGQPVSLIDLYPTLVDLCDLPKETGKNAKGRPLDGHSLKPLLAKPDGGWTGPAAVLTAMYKWADYYDPAEQNYALRDKEWRYIRYENGKEELYHVVEDPHEWTNLALDSKYEATLFSYRESLLKRIPKSIPKPEVTADEWKDRYFKRHPGADTNKDGKLTWAEHKAHKKLKAKN